MIHKRNQLLVPGRSSVPVSSYACLWIASYETGHTLPSSSSWEVARDWEWAGGGKKRGEERLPPIQAPAFCDIEWKSKRFDLLSAKREEGWAVVRLKGIGQPSQSCGCVKTAWEMKGFVFCREGCKCNVSYVSQCARDSRQVRLSLLCARSDYSSGRGLLRNSFLIQQLFRFTRAQQTETVFWDTGHSLLKSCSFIFTLFFLFFLVRPVYIWVKHISITSSFILISFPPPLSNQTV